MKSFCFVFFFLFLMKAKLCEILYIRILSHFCLVKFAFFSPSGGNPLLFRDPDMADYRRIPGWGTHHGGGDPQNVKRLTGGWRAREERVETTNREWNRPAKENRKDEGDEEGIWSRDTEKKTNKRKASTNQKREEEEEENWESSMMQMSRATLVTPELVLFLVYNFKTW